jgi:hypothetical protein
MPWYVRETFMAILCANLPRLTPLFLYMVGVVRRRHVAIPKAVREPKLRISSYSRDSATHLLRHCVLKPF